MFGPIVPKTIIVISKSDLDHIMYDHVWVTAETAMESNKNIFDKSWLRSWDDDLRSAVGKVADFVLQNGERAPTEGAVEEDVYDYYHNFNTQTGWHAGGARFKGVVIRAYKSRSLLPSKRCFRKAISKLSSQPESGISPVSLNSETGTTKNYGTSLLFDPFGTAAAQRQHAAV